MNPCPVINVVNLDNAAFLFVPPAPSSTIIKSELVKSAPISVPPSISNAAKSTLPAVDIVDNLLSLILPYYHLIIQVNSLLGLVHLLLRIHFH